MNHNSDERPRDMPFFLTGSQRKTAHALELNVARLIREAGIETVGFLTLTVGDDSADGFRQVWDAAEASRRIDSLARRVLRGLFSRWVVVTERHKSGAIHFHLIGALASRRDILTGYDHAACEAGDYSSVSSYLRDLWSMLRRVLPDYGFGRAELTPIKSNGEAVSRYVSKYVEKNLFNRIADDKGKKLVRYGGWRGSHCRSNDICWTSERAVEWRKNAETLAGCIGNAMGVQGRKEVGNWFGPRWAFRLSRVMQTAADASNLPEDEWRQHLLRWTSAEVIYHDWQRWESYEEWAEYASEKEAIEARETVPEWLQIDLIPRPVWPVWAA